MNKQDLKKLIKEEISNLLERDRNRPMGLDYIKDSAKQDGEEALSKYLTKHSFRNIPDTEAYVEGFLEGVGEKGREKTGKSRIKYFLMPPKELDENVNPELDKLVINFIKSIAKRYDYSTWDGFNAVEQTMNKLKDYFGEGKYD